MGCRNGRLEGVCFELDVLGMRPWQGIWYDETEREGHCKGLVARVEVSGLSL
jgi:hypothetical protein